MHVVYKITFKKRLQDNTPPYYYVGSKSNCTYSDGVLYDNRNNPYYGSSSWESYDRLVEEGECHAEIIKSFDSYTDALNYERTIQVGLDVVANPDYFNLGIATINNFTSPNFATYKHKDTGKCVRLDRNHPNVLDGTYVGVTKGVELSPEERKKRGRAGEDNAFYGRTHTKETKRLISEANKGRVKSEEEIDNWVAKVASKPKSPEHRAKMGRKGMIMLKNLETLQVIRIPRQDKHKYDEQLWLNPGKANKILRERNNENQIN